LFGTWGALSHQIRRVPARTVTTGSYNFVAVSRSDHGRCPARRHPPTARGRRRGPLTLRRRLESLWSIPGARPCEKELMPSPQRACTSTYLHDLLPPPREPRQTVHAESEPRLPAKAGARGGADPNASVALQNDLHRVARRAPSLWLRNHRPCASSPPRPVDPGHSDRRGCGCICATFVGGSVLVWHGGVRVHAIWGLPHIFHTFKSQWLALQLATKRENRPVQADSRREAREEVAVSELNV
jgi:hypothetical protein